MLGAKTTTNGEYITSYNRIPYNVISSEINGTQKSDFLQDLGHICECYKIYREGAKFITEGTSGDYTPAYLRYKQAKNIIDKEARFLFSNPPSITIEPLGVSNQVDRNIASEWKNILGVILEKNKFSKKLLKAAKDCFIGKRVALVLNFNDNGVAINFVPALEFYHEVDMYDPDKITKIVTFSRLVDSTNSSEVRLFKKKYWLENGCCWVEENIYDGSGKLMEEVTLATKTLFTYVPAVVIINDGLTGDIKGSSEIDSLSDYESWYSRLASADIDAERKSMNPIRYAMDCSPESTENLSSAAGSLWDLQSDQNGASDKQGSVGSIELSMMYKDALKLTLDRIKNTMHEQLDVPNIDSESMKGMVTSGKTLKAIYWGLLVRCNEKLKDWIPVLEFMVTCIIDGVTAYPNTLLVYNKTLPKPLEYNIEIEGNYPLPEDEETEKAIDLSEVGNLTMSRKAYMKKWRGLTDDEVTEELKQMAEERQILEDSFSNIIPQ